jgi:methylenetetrahydrofolate dehydrogenase (NADP+) / methenyltetrahydrofolate cyclohydrolase
MIVDGKAIAADILREVGEGIRALGRPLRLGVLFVSPDFATQKFIAIKEKRAEELGVEVVKRELPADVTTADAIAAVGELSAQTDGVIVQLPFSGTVGVEALLAAVPPEKDVDVIGRARIMLSPVTAALEAILLRHGIDPRGKSAVVVGQGNLVGKPASAWLAETGAAVVTLTEGDDIATQTREADIIVLGAGRPGLLTPEMVKEGVVVLDAGTSESAGKLAGDAAPEVAAKAALFTPVPGGVGPVAVAMIFKNLMFLAQGAPRVEA